MSTIVRRGRGQPQFVRVELKVRDWGEQPGACDTGRQEARYVERGRTVKSGFTSLPPVVNSGRTRQNCERYLKLESFVRKLRPVLGRKRLTILLRLCLLRRHYRPGTQVPGPADAPVGHDALDGIRFHSGTYQAPKFATGAPGAVSRHQEELSLKWGLAMCDWIARREPKDDNALTLSMTCVPWIYLQFLGSTATDPSGNVAHRKQIWQSAANSQGW